MKNLALAAAFAIFLAGCSNQPNPNQIYKGLDGYSNELYNYEVTEDPTNLIKKIETIIEKNHPLVPPGIYAQLGYIYAKQSQSQMAIKFFEKEMELFPESQIFMQRVIKKIKEGK